MEKKRIIFDLDGTLLSGDFSFIIELFDDLYKEHYERVIKLLPSLLDEYEKMFPYYDKELLGEFLTNKVGLPFDRYVIDYWVNSVDLVPDIVETGAIDLLDYLKSQGFSLAVLTNWFSKTQVSRLKRSGMYEYFDNVYTGDYRLKPNYEAYDLARGEFDFRECVMVGDNLEKDYFGPKLYFMDAILYDKEDRVNQNIVKVKRLEDIKNKY